MPENHKTACTERTSLHTVKSLIADLQKLGVNEGSTVVVHSSLKAIGHVCGEAVAVILALENVLGKRGTLVIPTFTLNLCDPSEPENRYPELQWDIVREHLPGYFPDLSPTTAMGFVAETFRKQNGVIRSSHPHLSFAAWGIHAERIIANHSLHYGLGEGSPLARIYDLHGSVLLLGAPKDTNTSLHLAEYRQHEHLRGTKDWAFPSSVSGEQTWMIYHDIRNRDDDFVQIHDTFIYETGLTKEGTVGDAPAYLMPQCELVDFAVKWMNENREQPHPPMKS